LDKYDISFLINNIDKKMPQHSTEIHKIPTSYDTPFPKKFMEFSHKVDNKFLNDHQSEIEEADNNNFLSKSFKNWYHKQQNYHKEQKNHDGFFTKLKNCIEADMKCSTLACGFIISPFRFKLPAVNGQELVTATGGTDVGSFGNNNIQCFRLPSGDLTDLYDQVALNIAASSGSVKLSVYDDSSGEPENLYSTEVENASATGYTYRSLTEFGLNTVQNWAAFNNTANGMHPAHTVGSTNDRQWTPSTYTTAFLDPFTTSNYGSDLANMKIGHS
tara:strand:- start:38 stop:856 length:819 start_codon:yes stop_codon:yes gene_type:complete